MNHPVALTDEIPVAGFAYQIVTIRKICLLRSADYSESEYPFVPCISESADSSSLAESSFASVLIRCRS